MKNLHFAIGFILCISLLAGCRESAGGLTRPTGVAVAADGSLYVMDHVDRSHSRVLHINPSGEIQATFQPANQKAGLIYSGWDIAVGPTGNVYYCNLVSNDERTVHDGMMAFSPKGKFLFEFGAFDYSVNSTQLSHVPYNLDVDQRGWIYVADFDYKQVRVFDSNGQLLTTFTHDNVKGFNYRGTGDVAVDDQRNLLYLTDFFDGRLDQYRMTILADGSIQLSLQWSVGAYGHGPREFSFPQYLAVDKVTGTVYVGDMGNRRILAVDPQGNFIADGGSVSAFSPPAVDEWQVLGLAVGPDGLNPGDQVVYAADAFNHVIWAFKPDGQFLRKIEVH